jgi:predicted nuclease with TOPRIM domain
LKAYAQTQTNVLELKKRLVQEGRYKLDIIEKRGNELMDSLEERREKVKELAAKGLKIQEEKSKLSEKLKSVLYPQRRLLATDVMQGAVERRRKVG